MIPVIPWYVTSIVFLAGLAAGLGTWVLLSSAAARSGLPASAQRRVRIGVGLFLAIWSLGILLVTPAPASLLGRERSYLTPVIPFFALAPIAVALVAFWRSAALRRTLDAASVPGVIAVQVYRVAGVAFIILLAQGQLPAHFANPAGWGDIAIGLAAPLVGLALASGLRAGRFLGLVWNGVGIADLVVAVGMGTGRLAPVLAPGLGSSVPPAAAMGVYPMILVPAFVVPLSILLHAVALRGLSRRAVPRGEVAGRAVPVTH